MEHNTRIATTHSLSPLGVLDQAIRSLLAGEMQSSARMINRYRYVVASDSSIFDIHSHSDDDDNDNNNHWHGLGNWSFSMVHVGTEAVAGLVCLIKRRSISQQLSQLLAIYERGLRSREATHPGRRVFPTVAEHMAQVTDFYNGLLDDVRLYAGQVAARWLVVAESKLQWQYSSGSDQVSKLVAGSFRVVVDGLAS